MALPDKVVTNADYEARIDTSDAWIVERTGIRERRHGGTTSGLAVQAGQTALDKAGIAGSDIDLLVLSTTTPDQAVPATSATVHAQLGLTGAAFDLNAACAGFVYSVVTAVSMLGLGYRRALVIDGSLVSVLCCDHGGYIFMEGREVFRKAVRASVDSAMKVLDAAEITADDIALYVPHQANQRIIDAAVQRLGLAPEKSAIVLDRTGNTSSGSMGIALAEAADEGRLSDGDLVLLSGFGAGMTWASAVLRWGS
jgi:3-oxoacyl-[acyl-carrier-protein] synthase-3